MTNSDMAEQQQHWLEHVKAAEASEGTQADYARANGIKARELYQWKTVLIRRQKPGAYSPVVVTTAGSTNISPRS